MKSLSTHPKQTHPERDRGHKLRHNSIKEKKIYVYNLSQGQNFIPEESD